MSTPAIRRLVREWAALLAVLVLALGPLAAAVERSRGASAKIAVAAGLAPPALCLPADMGGADDGPMPDCDRCTLSKACAPGWMGGVAAPLRTAASDVIPGRPLHTGGFPRAPPARGPPTA
jgi:hypothetical protein